MELNSRILVIGKALRMNPLMFESVDLSSLENRRLTHAQSSTRAHKALLGQFFTPTQIALRMSELFDLRGFQSIRLLDPGAGIGVLSCAFMESARQRGMRVESVTAFELDDALADPLSASLRDHVSRGVISTVRSEDFIASAVGLIGSGHRPFNAAILNPPYKKISSDSEARRLASSVGVEAPNLYALFVLLSLMLLEDGGELVAIIPRSFANGTYYRAFRRSLCSLAAINRIHVFDSRTRAFKSDDVLQENVIIHCTRSGTQGDVTVSSSLDDTFLDLVSRVVPFSEIVHPSDAEMYMHFPSGDKRTEMGLHHRVAALSLPDIGLSVSTGPIVDFRLRAHLRRMPERGTAALIYPGHLSTGVLEWPDPTSKKPNAIAINDVTQKLLYPSGSYCVVRRFSSKEERRRVFASAILPAESQVTPELGFENHLNVFHSYKQGIPEELALGLAAYLNTTIVDELFRSFSGHTQVNATDLRWLKYPPVTLLEELGKWAREHRQPAQLDLDQEYERVLRNYIAM